MERTKWRELKLPDAINRCNKKEGFTQVSNSFIRDPNISAVAKAILVMLLSNKDGWISHKTTLKTMMKEGRDSIQSGLTELRKLGYLTYIGFRDKNTKEFKGSFWAYTDVANDFVYHKNLKILESKGFEVIIRKPAILPRNTEVPLYGKPVTNNTIIKNKEISDEIFNRCPLKFRFGTDHERYEGCNTCDEANHKLFSQCKMARYIGNKSNDVIMESYSPNKNRTVPKIKFDINGTKFILEADGVYRNRRGFEIIE